VMSANYKTHFFYDNTSLKNQAAIVP